MLMYGSTMFFVQVLQSLAPHPKLWTTVGVDPGTYTLAAGMATSGTALPPGFKTSSAASRSNASSKRRLLSGLAPTV
jgi:hypothetical protein